jgi:tRNA threonylcarbamoyladenosine biosynthesis protein TsaB
MNLLAFDTSTEILHIAVQAGARAPIEHRGTGGPHASVALIPAIQSLLRDAGLRLADLDAIVFGRGPGSFTGLRTACSVAQGLSFGSGVPVVPVDTLLAIAEDARHREGATQVVAVLDARMDEVYSAAYGFEAGQWRTASAITLGAPEALRVAPGWALAGNGFATYADRLPAAARRIEAAPAAGALLRLAPALIASGHAGPAATATPLYIRDKVAQTTEERAAIRASRSSPP